MRPSQFEPAWTAWSRSLAVRCAKTAEWLFFKRISVGKFSDCECPLCVKSSQSSPIHPMSALRQWRAFTFGRKADVRLKR